METAIQQTPAQRIIGEICKRLHGDAKKRRVRFEESGRELMKYGYSKDYLFEYQTINPRAWYKAKYAKTAEAFGVIVPRITPPGNANRLITLSEPNPALAARSEARQFYLNYTPQFTGWFDHRQSVSEEAVGYGRGAVYTTRDTRTGLICSRWKPIEDIWDDPNAITPDDRHMMIVRETELRSDAIAKYPQAAEALNRLPKAGEPDACRGQQIPRTDDVICYYVFWFDRGIHTYDGGYRLVQDMARERGQGISEDQAKTFTAQMPNAPIKYLLSEEYEVLYECPWPIPFHQLVSDPWPYTFYDPIRNTQSIYPVSMLDSAIGIQRAMNHIVTLAMGKMRHDMKVSYVAKKQNRNGPSKEDVRRALAGADIERIEIEFNGTTGSISDYFEKLDWSMGWVQPTMAFLDRLESVYERLTGMYSWLHTGQGSVQDRSAEATRARERNSMARIEHMRDRGAAFDSMVARKEAFAAAHELTPDDVSKVLPPRLSQQWGNLVTPEAMSPDYWITQAQDQGIIDPNQQVMFAQQNLAMAYTLDEITYQSQFELEATSTRRKDIDQQIEMMEKTKNQVTSVQLQSQDPEDKAMGYETLALDAKLQGLPLEFQDMCRTRAQSLRMQAQMMQQMAMQQQQMAAQGAPAQEQPPQQ
jgi:hypothetical protein